MIDPLLNEESELIVEDKIEGNNSLREKMLEDVCNMPEQTKKVISTGMLKMHKHFEDECGDLDVSLNSEEEILQNTQPWYIILDDVSTIENRVVRYHYRANWETSHGVEVIVINGNHPIFVGICGYSNSIDQIATREKGGFSFV